MIGWLRRLWSSPRLTVPQTYPSTRESQAVAAAVEARVAARTVRVALAKEVLDALPPGTLDRVNRRQVLDAIRTAPCEPTRAPDRPDHVARAKANRAAHYRALGEDPEADWGPFVNPYDDEGVA